MRSVHALFQIRVIPCRHFLTVFKVNKVSVAPNKYILDSWWKDKKMRYILIPSSCDARD